MTADEHRTATARLIEAGAKGAERVASVTGIDKVLEDALEEAIVRALRSAAVERAIVRVIERNAVQDAIGNALTTDEVAEAILAALDTEIADRVWVELLAGRKVQMLVERIAEAPEVRAAITQQGAGLITDVGRRLTVITESLDDAAEDLVHRVAGRSGHETETNEAGLLTRGLAAAVDVGLIFVLLSVGSSLIASVVPFATGGRDGLSLAAVIVLSTLGVLAGSAILVAFWALVGQTPGMRFLSIHLESPAGREIGVRRALRRLLGLVLALVPFGLGFLAILLSPRRRGWHDRIAGTTVVYDTRDRHAPWTEPDASAASARP